MPLLPSFLPPSFNLHNPHLRSPQDKSPLESRNRQPTFSRLHRLDRRPFSELTQLRHIIQRDTFVVVGRCSPVPFTKTIYPTDPGKLEFMSIENLKTYDPFAEADEDTGEKAKAQDYIHIRIQQRNGRKTLTTVQGIPKKFSHKKILGVIKKKFACNGTIVNDLEMGEVIQLQGDQRKAMQEFLTDKDGLELDPKTIKVHGF